MGSANTPATPTTCVTSHNITYHPSYVGTHPATYGVCQHASYSYDTCDLNTITYYPSYVEKHPATYGVCQHAGYSYDTCYLTQYHIYLPSYVGMHSSTYGVCQHAGYSYDTCDLITISPNGSLTVNPGVKLPTFGQTDPRGSRPPNSDLKVPIGSTGSRTHVLQVWSISDDRIAHDRTIGRSDRSRSHNLTITETLALGLAFSEYPGLRPSNGPNLVNPDNVQCAISARDSNGIQIEIRAHLRARNIERITLGQNSHLLQCPRVAGAYPSPENLQISAQDSYPR
ncbi:unnamed protein product [Prunus armeniaca]